MLKEFGFKPKEIAALRKANAHLIARMESAGDAAMDDKTRTDKMLSRKEGGVGYVIFNNPERHNAVSLDMWAATADILETSATIRRSRVVVVTGAGGKAFVSGADISKFEKRALLDGGGGALQRDGRARLTQTFHEFPKPTIAMIRGYCIGGGMGLATCCDMRIASENSKFGVPAAKLGLGYAYPGLKRLVDVVGPSFAKEIFYTGAAIRPQPRRWPWAWSTASVPADELERYVKNYADTIAGNAPLTHQGGEVHRQRDDEGREQARPRRAPTSWSRTASPARTTSKAARPSWRSASRCSRASDGGVACEACASRWKREKKAASCRGRGLRFR